MRPGLRWPSHTRGCRRGLFLLMSVVLTGRCRRCYTAGGSARDRRGSCSASTLTCSLTRAFCWTMSVTTLPPGRTAAWPRCALRKPDAVLPWRSAPRPRPRGGRVSGWASGRGHGISGGQLTWRGGALSAAPGPRSACCWPTRKPARRPCLAMPAVRGGHCAMRRKPHLGCLPRVRGCRRGRARVRVRRCMRCRWRSACGTRRRRCGLRTWQMRDGRQVTLAVRRVVPDPDRRRDRARDEGRP